MPLWELLFRQFASAEFRILCMTMERGAESYGELKEKLHCDGDRLVYFVIPDDFYVNESL
jgi:hypothetical protein